MVKWFVNGTEVEAPALKRSWPFETEDDRFFVRASLANSLHLDPDSFTITDMKGEVPQTIEPGQQYSVAGAVGTQQVLKS